MANGRTPYGYHDDLLNNAVANQDTYQPYEEGLQKIGDRLNQPFDIPSKDYSYYENQGQQMASDEVTSSKEDPDLFGFVPGEWLPDWVKIGYNNSIEGLSRQLVTGEKRWDVPAEVENNLGTMEDIGATLMSFLTLTDMGAMIAGGGIGGFAVKGAVKEAAKQAIKQGVKTKLTKNLSKDVVQKVVQQNAPRAVQLLVNNGKVKQEVAEKVIANASKKVTNKLITERAVTGATGLGFYSGLQSGLGQEVRTGDISLVQTLADASRGAVLGAVTAGSGSALNSHLISKLGVPKTAAQKLAHSTAVKALEVGEFGTLSPALEGRMPEWKDYVHAAGTIGGLTIVNKTPKYAKKLMNMENPKLSMDSFGKEIAEAQFKTARKNDIWKNNEGEQITNVEFGKKKRKLTKKEKEQGQKEEYEVVKGEDVKTGEKVEMTGKEFLEQGFNRRRRVAEQDKIKKARHRETQGKMRGFLKWNNEKMTEAVNHIRALAGKDKIKPKKGKTGYSSLTEIERIKLLDYVRKMEHVEKTRTGLRESGASQFMIPKSTLFSKIIPDVIKQAQNRARSTAGLDIMRSIDIVDIKGATRVGSYMQALTEAGLNRGGVFAKIFGRWSVEVPDNLKLDFLNKKPGALKKSKTGETRLKLKRESQAKEYYEDLARRMEDPNHRTDVDVQKMRKILDEAFREAEKHGVKVANYMQDYFPHMVKADRMAKLANDVNTIIAMDSAFEGDRISSLPNTSKLLAEKINQLQSDGKLSKETIQAIDYIKKQLKDISDSDVQMAEAFLRLRKETQKTFTTVGWLEKSRKIDLPPQFYEKDARIVLTKYLTDVAKRTEFAREFGAKGEKFDNTISALTKLQEQNINSNPTLAKNIGKEIELIDKIYKIGFNLSETDPRFNWRDPIARKSAKVLVDFEVATKIGLGYATIPNITQTLISTAVKAGYWNTIKGGVKLAIDKDYRREVASSGLSNLSVFQMLMGLEPSDSFMGRAAHTLTKISGFQGMNKVNQYVAAAAGREYVTSLINARNSNIKWRRNWAEQSLKDLNIEGKTNLSGKEWVKSNQQKTLEAMYKFSRDAQLQRNVLKDPVFANDPRFRPLFLFKRFGYKQFNWMRENLTQEAKRGNFLPIIRLGVGGMFGAQFVTWSKKVLNNILAGEDVTYDESRLFIPGLPPGTPMGTLGSDVNTDMSQYTWGDFFDHVASVGAFGFITDILASESKYRAVEFLVKPAIFQDAMKGYDALQRIYKDIEDYGIGAGKRAPKYLAPILGTVPRRLSKRLETSGQKETYTRYRRGIIRGRILDALLEGKDKEANRMMQSWNRANPSSAFYVEDIGVEAIFDRAYKKAVKRTKP